MPRETRFPALTVTAVMAVPTFMILSGHPAMGAATLGGVLLAWVTHARLLMRAEQTRDARLLDYAQTATHLAATPRR